jgi:membrane glycosyltransferase
MAPVVLGLLLAGPVSWLTSFKAGPIERWALATKEDQRPPAVIVEANHRGHAWARRMETPDGLERPPATDPAAAAA